MLTIEPRLAPLTPACREPQQGQQSIDTAVHGGVVLLYDLFLLIIHYERLRSHVRCLSVRCLSVFPHRESRNIVTRDLVSTTVRMRRVPSSSDTFTTLLLLVNNTFGYFYKWVIV